MLFNFFFSIIFFYLDAVPWITLNIRIKDWQTLEDRKKLKRLKKRREFKEHLTAFIFVYIIVISFQSAKPATKSFQLPGKLLSQDSH